MRRDYNLSREINLESPLPLFLPLVSPLNPSPNPNPSPSPPSPFLLSLRINPNPNPKSALFFPLVSPHKSESESESALSFPLVSPHKSESESALTSIASEIGAYTGSTAR